MSDIRAISSYLNHLVTARTRYSVHSPFVYQLINEVLRPFGEPGTDLEQIEALREELLRSDEQIRVTDLGAGSQKLHATTRGVAAIANASLKSPRQARMLYRLIRYMDAKNILELGTSLGITSLYLAKAAEDGNLITIEGCPQTHRIATNIFAKAGTSNITAELGSFQTLLPEALQTMASLDMVFIDGDHRRDPTLQHFETCIAKAHDHSVFVFDDIHWSKGMEQAWEHIIQDDRVTVSIDTFHMGLVFFRKEQESQHFKLRI